MQRTAVLAVLLLVACVAATHSCIHHALRKPPIIAVPQPLAAARPFGAAAVAEPMGVRIAYVLDVDGTGVCSTVGQTVSNLQGDTVRCRAEDVLTDAKRSYVRMLMDAAAARVSGVLNVTRRTSALVPASKCGELNTSANVSSGGFADTDFVIYVTAVPELDPASTTLAWAYGCARDQANKRLFVGHVNFVPSVLWNAGSTPDPLVFEDNMYVAVHEIAHAFGFSNPFFTHGVLGLDGVLSTADTGLTTYFHPKLRKNVTRMTSPRVLMKAKTYFNCSTLDGVEIEDTGGAGTGGSHWEKRILAHEFMNGVMTGTKLYISDLTIAFFEDTGHYVGNYANNVDAGRMTYGKNTQCHLTDDMCNATALRSTNHFCFEKTANGRSLCTQDRSAVGVCYAPSYGADLPVFQQYFLENPKQGGFESQDYCPTVIGYSNMKCDNSSLPADATTGDNFTASSRCFASNLQAKQSGAAGELNGRCLSTRCLSSGQVVVQLPDAVASCPSDGAAGDAVFESALYHGSIRCPAWWEVCGHVTVVATATATTGAPTTAAASAATDVPTTAAPTTEVASSAVPATGTPTATDVSTAAPTMTTASPSTTGATTAVPTTAVPTTAVPTTAVPTTAVPTTAVPTTGLPTTAAPTTAVPTAAPTMAQTATYTGVTRISGDWSAAIATQPTSVMAAAQQFLATALPNASVTVTNVAAGSLVISFTAVSRLTSSGVEGLIRQAPLTSLQTSYQTLTGTSTSLSLLSTGPAQQSQKACSEACVAMVVVGVVVIIVVLVIVVMICRKKEEKPANASKQPYSDPAGQKPMVVVATRVPVPVRLEQPQQRLQVVGTNPLPSALPRLSVQGNQSPSRAYGGSFSTV